MTGRRAAVFGPVHTSATAAPIRSGVRSAARSEVDPAVHGWLTGALTSDRRPALSSAARYSSA